MMRIRWEVGDHRLRQRYKKKIFFHKIVTGDECWEYHYDLKQKKSVYGISLFTKKPKIKIQPSAENYMAVFGTVKTLSNKNIWNKELINLQRYVEI